jgi:hypothetical protein
MFALRNCGIIKSTLFIPLPEEADLHVSTIKKAGTSLLQLLNEITFVPLPEPRGTGSG